MVLPYEMIDEILCRLPVKPLLRFRCVSKGWCSLIDSTAFVKKHLKTALDCNGGVGLLILDTDQQFYLAGVDSLDDESAAVVQIDDPFKTFLLSDVQLLGASNGLMCVLKNERKDVFLLNPTTRKYRKIARVPPEFLSSFSATELHVCGFGYDEVHDDFKVVLIAECDVLFGGLIAMVYSLKANAWKQIDDVPTNIQFSTIMGLFASGSLHWMAIDDQNSTKDLIVSFNLELQQFKKVPLPPIEGTPLIVDRDIRLVRVGKYLSILDYSDSRRDVWLMNYPGDERTWYKALSREQFEIIGTLLSTTKLLAFSRSGEDLLLQGCSVYDTELFTKLVWYNLDRKTIKNVGIRGLPNYFSSILYTESLLQVKEDELLQ